MNRARVLLAVAVVVAGLATACGGSPGDRGYLDRAEIEAAIEEVRTRVELPPGHEWKRTLPADMQGNFAPGGADAFVLDEATCAWMDYWASRYEADDDAGMTEAIGGMIALREISAYDRNDQSYRDHIEAAVSKAELGDPSLLRRHLEQNC